MRVTPEADEESAKNRNYSWKYLKKLNKPNKKLKQDYKRISHQRQENRRYNSGDIQWNLRVRKPVGWVTHQDVGTGVQQPRTVRGERNDLAPPWVRQHNRTDDRGRATPPLLQPLLSRRIWRLFSRSQCVILEHFYGGQIHSHVCKWDHHPSVFSSLSDLIYSLYFRKKRLNLEFTSYLNLQLQPAFWTSRFWGK